MPKLLPFPFLPCPDKGQRLPSVSTAINGYLVILAGEPKADGSDVSLYPLGYRNRYVPTMSALCPAKVGRAFDTMQEELAVFISEP